MKTSSIAAVSGLLSVVLAQAHLHNHHARHQHEKREIVMNTVWEIITETVGITTTITIDVDATTTAEAAVTSDSPGAFIQPSTSSVSVAPTTASTSSVEIKIASTSPVSVTPTTFSSIYTPPTTSEIASTSVYVPPVVSTSSVYVPPVVSTSSVYVPPVVSTSSVYVPPVVATTSSTPVYVAPTSTTTYAASSTSSASSSTSTGECSNSSPCAGDLTYYTTGLGACGETNDGLTENVVALSYLLLGDESNNGEGGDNPYCGRTITVEYGGKTTTAKVVDKCMGCDTYSIDLSTAAFLDVAEEALGRVQGKWYFSD